VPVTPDVEGTGEISEVHGHDLVTNGGIGLPTGLHGPSEATLESLVF
jgi:hypothetical protein